MMIRTPVCELLGIDHPIALGGMGSVYSPQMVAAVSNAGGLGAMGCHNLPPDRVSEAAISIREGTDKPYALNFLLFSIEEESFSMAIKEKPTHMAFAWPRANQELRPFIERAHDIGCKVTFMAGSVPEAVRAAEAGADIIVSQGTEGGGHVSWMTSMALLPMVVDAVEPIPVLAAGGFADGRGLAAALALGADGVLVGTRFLASTESPLHPNFKQAIVDSDGHDTLLTEIPDIAQATVWPGAMSRAKRNSFIETWIGREWALRRDQEDVFARITQARETGDIEGAPLSMGQDAGLVNEIIPAGEIVKNIMDEAEAILLRRLPNCLV